MKRLRYEGCCYRSLSECCRALGISYARVMRLTRKYDRARRDPSVAVEWILGKRNYEASKEVKTIEGIRDRELARGRQKIFRDRRVHLRCRELG